METLFYAANKTKPNSDLADAYKLVKSFRDGLQKAIWVNKGNPNSAKLVAALRSKFQRILKVLRRFKRKLETMSGC